MSRGLVRKLAIGLAVSLALNMFLLGVLSVQLLRPRTSADGLWTGGPRTGEERSAERGPGREPSAGVGPRTLFHAAEVFGQDRPRVSHVLRAHKGELRSRWHETKRARSRVEAALRAEPFERDLLARELEGLRNETQRSQEVLHRALVEVAVEATPEQRRRLASWADEHRPRRPSRRGTPSIKTPSIKTPDTKTPDTKTPPQRSLEPGSEPGVDQGQAEEDQVE